VRKEAKTREDEGTQAQEASEEDEVQEEVIL
jgi:hypothetical protein